MERLRGSLHNSSSDIVEGHVRAGSVSVVEAMTACRGAGSVARGRGGWRQRVASGIPEV